MVKELQFILLYKIIFTKITISEKLIEKFVFCKIDTLNFQIEAIVNNWKIILGTSYIHLTLIEILYIKWTKTKYMVPTKIFKNKIVGKQKSCVGKNLKTKWNCNIIPLEGIVKLLAAYIKE